MKRFALLAAAAVVLSGCAAQTPPPVSDKVMAYYTDHATTAPLATPEYIPAAGFLGDSYTIGDGSSDRANRWTSLLARKRGWVETNAGYGGTGYGTAGRLAGGQPYDARVGLVTNTVANAAKPIIIVSGGRNDFTENTPAAKVEAGITKTFTDLRKAAPKAKIIALSPLWDDDPAPEELAVIGEQVKAAVTKIGGQYIDVGQPLANRPGLLDADGVHPNDQGYATLAAAIDAKLPKNLP